MIYLKYLLIFILGWLASVIIGGLIGAIFSADKSKIGGLYNFVQHAAVNRSVENGIPYSFFFRVIAYSALLFTPLIGTHSVA